MLAVIVKASSGPRYVVGCRTKVDKAKLKPGTRVALDMTTLTIMRYLPREVTPVMSSLQQNPRCPAGDVLMLQYTTLGPHMTGEDASNWVYHWPAARDHRAAAPSLQYPSVMVVSTGLQVVWSSLSAV